MSISRRELDDNSGIDATFRMTIGGLPQKKHMNGMQSFLRFVNLKEIAGISL